MEGGERREGGKEERKEGRKDSHPYQSFAYHNTNVTIYKELAVGKRL